MKKNVLKINYKTEFLPVFLILLSFAFSIFFINNFPDIVAIHWDIYGSPDSFSNKYLAALSIPVIILLIYFLLTFLPNLDPKKERYSEFSKIYNYFRSLIIFFMLFVYLVSGFNNLGYNISIAKLMPISIGALFFLIGFYMKKIKMNWFVGVKNPWTLSSEYVWDKTHKFSGKIFMFSALLFFLTAFTSSFYKIFLFVTALFLIIFSTTIYSYLIYLKENKKIKNKKNGDN